MGAAIGGVATLIRIVSALLFYGILAVVLLLLYKISREVADIKRSISDLEERIMLAMLPREKSDKPEQP